MTCLVDRWNMLHSPLHAAGILLDPKYRLHDYCTNIEIMDGWDAVCSKMIGAGPEFASKRALVKKQLTALRDESGPFSALNVDMCTCGWMYKAQLWGL